MLLGDTAHREGLIGEEKYLSVLFDRLPSYEEFMLHMMLKQAIAPIGERGCIAQRQHTFFSPSSSRFDSQHSQKFSDEKLLMWLRLINGAG